MKDNNRKNKGFVDGQQTSVSAEIGKLTQESGLNLSNMILKNTIVPTECPLQTSCRFQNCGEVVSCMVVGEKWEKIDFITSKGSSQPQISQGMSISCPPCRCPGGPYLHSWPQGPPAGPKIEPKYTKINQISVCPHSNSIVKGHPSLKSPKECLYHVHLPSWCLGGPYHTFVAIGATLRPKKQAQIRPN